METIFASLVSASVTLIVCIINNRSQNDKTRALMEYKLDELTERVNKHNSLIERTYRLEEDVALHEEKIKVVNHRLEDLENGR
jgi:hypothetical protein